jgi:hypothetical protein
MQAQRAAQRCRSAGVKLACMARWREWRQSESGAAHSQTPRLQMILLRQYVPRIDHVSSQQMSDAGFVAVESSTKHK